MNSTSIEALMGDGRSGAPVAHEDICEDLRAVVSAISPIRLSVDSLPAARAATPPAPPRSTAAISMTEETINADADLALRIHRPTRGVRPLPCIVSFHGGGYVLGNRQMDDSKFATWVPELGCIGISVEYRLAPETQHPGPLDDCWSAIRWVHENAEELGVDTRHIGVAGTSAGAGLAAAVALKARDCGLPLAFQVLEAPMLDDRQHTASSRRDGLPIWDRVVNEFAWRCYLGPLYGTDEVPELAAPARATDLGGLPPTFVVVGSIDGFHDEAVMYATRLNRAGVASELHIYPGAPHGYQLFETSAVAQQSSRDVLAWLRRQLPPPPAVR